ncbi:MAG: 2-hydroxyacid dehydrogenase [Chloroflexota bacterium]
MSLSVHVLREMPAEALVLLAERLEPAVHLTHGLELPEPAACHILVTGRLTREHLRASPNLRAIVVPWAGLPDTVRALAPEFPHIAVHNLHHNAAPVAELAVTLMLAAAKFILPLDRALRQSDWRPRYRGNPSVLLVGKTALILGYGAIGQRVACVCRGLGMTVIATRRNPEASRDGDVEIHPPQALHRLLPRANVLLICLPLTDETTGLVGERELALLPPGAVLVNIGRGPIVDEAALYHALCEGRLHAAGLDVWYNYPADEAARAQTPPSAFPFHELENVVMSPHRGGQSHDTELLRAIELARLLNAAARGEPMPNRVDLQAGY